MRLDRWEYITWSILYYLRNDPEKLRNNLIKRGMDPSVVDEALKYDTLWRKCKFQLDKLRHEHKVLSKKIGRAKSKEEREKLISEAKKLLEQIQSLERKTKEYKLKRDRILLAMPNVVEDDVPVGEDESDNVPVMYWGKPKVWGGFLDRFLAETVKRGFKVEYEVIEWKPRSHYDMIEFLGKADTLKAGEVAGSRFYYLFDDLVWLDYALQLYAIDYLTRKGYSLVEPPLMLKRRYYEAVTSLEDFEDAIYKIEGKDLYLIATSEHPIAALHANEVIPADELPLKYVGISPCFRKEAGAHGKDTRGIFRVHNFNKVEQFIFCLPEDSKKYHQELLQNAIELWRGLGIPFRVVLICTGDLGIVASKKYDIEAWMPAQGRFREVVSCSNCTDWQSYRLNIRYVEKRGQKPKGYVHTLNSTAIATSRAITAILENYQEEDGTVIIPRVLRKYLEPFKAAPKEAIYPVKKEKSI